MEECEKNNYDYFNVFEYELLKVYLCVLCNGELIDYLNYCFKIYIRLLKIKCL